MNVRTVVPSDVLESLSRVGNENGFNLSKQDKANACMVDDPVTVACAAWMKDHFSLGVAVVVATFMFLSFWRLMLLFLSYICHIYMSICFAGGRGLNK